MIYTTQEEIDHALVTWQQRLRLQDWDVKARLVRVRELGPNRQGDIDWRLEKRTAYMRILHGDDYPEDCLWPQDHEVTVVHELLHLHFAPFTHPVDTPEDTAEEVAIHRISEALVAGYRQGS